MNVKIKKTLLILLLFGILILTMLISSGGISGMSAFYDIPSLIVVVFPVVFMLFFADLMGDYIRALKFVWGNAEYTTKELKASIEAVNLSIKLISITGVVGTMIGLVIVFALEIPNTDYWYPSLSVLLLTAFYAILINLMQLPIKSCLTKEIIYREN